MQLLLVHQNFPGQFRELGPAWLAAGHQLTAIGCQQAPQWPGLNYWQYALEPATPLQRGQAVAQLGLQLLSEGFRPDAVIAHSGWGEALLLRQAFPEAALIAYPEIWLSPLAFGIGFDPEIRLCAASLEHQLSQLQQLNLLADLAIHQADAVVVPTAGQRASFPPALQSRITVIPDGVNDARLKPNPQAQLLLPGGLTLKPGDPVVTLVSRQLEPLRGLRQLLKAWPAVAAQHPNARLVLVGGDDGGYGIEAPQEANHLEDALRALPMGTNRAHIHVLGRVEHNQLVSLLQCSACHVGLSYPYTVSWSTMEALACGAPLVTNAGHPLAPDLEHGHHASIVPFDDTAALAAAIADLLHSEARRRAFGTAGHSLIQQRFSLDQALAGYQNLFCKLLPAGP